MAMASTCEIGLHQRSLDLADCVLRAAKRTRLTIPIYDFARDLAELRSEVRVELGRHFYFHQPRPA